MTNRANRRTVPNMAKPVMKIKCPRCGGAGKIVDLDGGAFRTVREHSGISLREVARRAQISAAYLSDIEHGRRAPSAKTRESLLQALARAWPTSGFKKGR